MKTCFQIAECSFSSAKIMEIERKTSSLLDFLPICSLFSSKIHHFLPHCILIKSEETRLLPCLPFSRHSIFVSFLDIPDKISAPPNCTH